MGTRDFYKQGTTKAKVGGGSPVHSVFILNQGLGALEIHVAKYSQDDSNPMKMKFPPTSYSQGQVIIDCICRFVLCGTLRPIAFYWQKRER